MIKIAYINRAEWLTIKVSGQMDSVTDIGVLNNEFNKLRRLSQLRNLAIDMGDLDNLNSALLGLLIEEQRYYHSLGMGFILANPSQHFREILEICDMSHCIATEWEFNLAR